MHLMDDATLVAAARSGDDTAWAAIYDRYADKLHDHCHRILRDRDEAADALHDAFLAAARNLHQLREPDRLRPWLYSICRHTSLRRLKARDRVDLTDSTDDLMAVDDDLGRGVQAEELSELLWAAAAGLNGRDQALLDLNVRQGLEGQDLADAMGTTLNNSYVMLSRMRDQVERSLGALLVARQGRDDCPELAALLSDWDGTFSPLLRKRVARHVDGCEICSDNRKRAASPLALLALAPLVPAPALLKTRVISSIRNVDVVDPPHVPFTKAGFAVLDGAEQRRRPKAAWLAVAAALLLVLGGLALGARGDDGTSSVTAAGATSTSLGTRTSATDAPTTTAAVILDGGTTPTSDPAADPGTDAPSERTTTTVRGTKAPPRTTTTRAPGTTTTTAPADRTPPSIGAPSGQFLGCSGSNASVRVTVTVTDASPVTVTLITPRGSQGMSGSGSSYSATVSGAFSGSFAFVVRATDKAGNKAPNRTGTVNVPPCGTTTTQPPTTTTVTEVTSTSTPPIVIDGPG